MPDRFDLDALEPRRLMAAGDLVARVDFGPAGSAVAGSLADAGAAFADRGGGRSYGWSSDNRSAARARPTPVPGRDPTFVHTRGRRWELAVPDGTYVVRIVAGDPAASDSTYAVDVEGTPAFRHTADDLRRYRDQSVEVTVNDGRLTVGDGDGASNNKLASVEVYEGGGIDWQQKASSPITRIEPQTAVVGGRMFVFGGYNDSFWPSPRVDAYDAAADEWTRLRDMPTGRTHAATAVDGKFVYLIGGYLAVDDGVNQTFGSRQVLRYDTTRDRYARLPDLPGARGSGGAAVIDGHLHYFAGERPERSVAPHHWRLDLSDPDAGWRRKRDHPNPTTHSGTVTIGSRAYSLSGQTTGEADRDDDYVRSNWVYEARRDRWRRLADLPGVRSHLTPNTVLSPRGTIVLVGGESTYNRDVRTVSEYDPETDTWRELTPIPEKRASGAAGFVGDRLVFTSGKDSESGLFHDETWVGEVLA